VLVSFNGTLHKYLGKDRRWLGLIDFERADGPLKFEFLPVPTACKGPDLGGVGLTTNDNLIVSALQWNSPMALIFDRELRFLDAVPGVIGDVHSIALRDNVLYTALCAFDSVVAWDLGKGFTQSPVFELGTNENRHHLNSVVFGPDEDLFVAWHDAVMDPSFCHATIANITKGLLIQTPGRVPRLHSLTFFGDEIAFCDSWNGRVVIGSREYPLGGFVRGLLVFEDFFIVGVSIDKTPTHIHPAGGCSLLFVDRTTGKILNKLEVCERWEIYSVIRLS
jgi:hypothetical protein